eukprot:4964894-Ditylum_brightwellii.AAC.1
MDDDNQKKKGGDNKRNKQVKRKYDGGSSKGGQNKNLYDIFCGIPDHNAGRGGYGGSGGRGNYNTGQGSGGRGNSGGGGPPQHSYYTRHNMQHQDANEHYHNNQVSNVGRSDSLFSSARGSRQDNASQAPLWASPEVHHYGFPSHLNSENDSSYDRGNGPHAWHDRSQGCR